MNNDINKNMPSDQDNITLLEISQIDIYGGFPPEKLPELNQEIAEQMLFAQDFFNNEPFVVLAPDTITYFENNEQLFSLPPILSAGYLKTIKNKNEICCLRAVWWQYGFGSPEPSILKKLKETQWEEPYCFTLEQD